MTEAQDKGNRFESRKYASSRYRKFREGTLVCVNCSRTYLIRDIDSFLDKRWMLWHSILSRIKNSYLKQQIVGSLAIANAKQSIISEVQKYGMLTNLCDSCMAHLLRQRE